jgi:hypothetical protein
MKTCFRTGDKHVALFDITRFPLYTKLKKELDLSYIIPPNVDGFLLPGANRKDPALRLGLS